MEWSRVKTILIWVFAIVNVFLLVTYIRGSQASGVADRQTVEDTITILQANHVKIQEKVMPKDITTVRLFDIQNKLRNPEDTVKYTLEEGKAGKMNEESFTYTCTVSPVSNLNASRAKSIAKKEVKRHRLLGKSDYDITVSPGKDNSFTVVYTPVYEKKKIIDSRLCITATPAGEVTFSGENWLLDNITDSGMINVSPVTEVLINFATDKKRGGKQPCEITKVDIGYYVGSRNGEIAKVTALPVWEITTDGGETYYYDVRDAQALNQ